MNCPEWIVANGEEINCQWKKDHIGCHSGYFKLGKVKWYSQPKDPLQGEKEGQ